jgi:hypothetical protein
MGTRVTGARPAARTSAQRKAAKPTPEPAPLAEDIPSFSTGPDTPVYDGPVLMRIDDQEFRMRTDRFFAGSLLYLHTAKSRGLRAAQFALIEHVAGPAALEALLSVADLEGAQWQTVMERVAAHLVNNLEEA